MSDREAIEVDVVVVGAGAAGLSAALTAAVEGGSVALLEKSSMIGGTTAVSGGLVWIPNNHRMPELGMTDSVPDVIAYIERNADGRGDPELIALYVEKAPAMMQYLEKHAPTRFDPVPGYPDYQPELPGGVKGGRAIEGPLFDTNTIGAWAPKLRRSPLFGRSPMRVREATEWGAFSRPMQLPFKEIGARAKAGFVCRGAALSGHLFKGCLDRGVSTYLDTAAKSLLVEGSRVVGLVATDAEGERTFRARRGVILASGGFEWNKDLVRRFLGGQLTHPASPPQNEGDGLLMAMSVGAHLCNMTEAWWAPSVELPGERYDGAPLYRSEFAIRTMPHSLIVNRKGERFVDEALNYNDLMKGFFTYDPVAMERPHLPAWVVVDSQFLSKYLFLDTPPGRTPPDHVARGETLEELAARIGVDAAGLARTVERFNGFARAGVDEDFHRGRGAYDVFYGDSEHEPNPCLGTLEKGPYYALEIKPGSLGTKGGPETDAHARVKRATGGVVPGLYAAGNVAGSLAGSGYPGPGITIGAALLFGHRAAMHALDKHEQAS